MRALYHLTIPASPMADCEAVAQDVRLLQHVAVGRSIHLYPTRRPGTRIPRAIWGLERLPLLWRLERSIDVHHIFNPDPFPFPVLRLLRRPIVYTIVGSVSDEHCHNARRVGALARAVIVSSQADQDCLIRWGISQTHVVQPAVDVTRLQYTSISDDAPPTLLAGSAPWTGEQFVSKGVDALLEAALRRHELRLIFLWRGVLFDEMMRRVATTGLQERVRVLNERVDVNEVLAGVTAGVVLATRPDVVKAYPHSLLECLAAGKPVLVSRAIRMSEWVEKSNLGCVIDVVNADHILRAVDTLRQARFSPQRLQAAVAGHTERFLAAHRQIYEWVIGRRSR
ncbi:MAG: glycosyltransferase [Anaerolineae bacterium]|nr:glycosyltransferase [Thermoflexales bacterium]MDW8407491.1 glycosyltransferase [Anaerolineae bacterium]